MRKVKNLNSILERGTTMNVKNIFKKKETDEEVVKLTPEEKKEKLKKIGITIGKTVGMVAAGAACVLIAMAGIGHFVPDTEENADDEMDGSCEELTDAEPEEETKEDQ